MGAPEDAVEEDADARASQIEKELKLEKLRLKKLKARTKAMRREKFKSAVMPMAACVSRIDVDGLERTHNDVVENIVRWVKFCFQTLTNGLVKMRQKSVFYFGYSDCYD
jgi:hypothetical protein